MTENWYSTGFTQTEQAVAESERKKDEQKNAIRRFYLKAQQSKNIVFVDDVAFEIWEHNLKLNGQWGNYFTCIGEKNGCPLCAAKRPYYVSFFTVLDLDGWVDKKGHVQGKNALLLFPAKVDVSVSIKHQKELRPDKTLVGCQFNVLRNSSKDYSTGSQFSFIKAFDRAYTLNKYQPANYQEILKPWPIERLQAIVASGATQTESGPAGQGADGSSDDIPF